MASCPEVARFYWTCLALCQLCPLADSPCGPTPRTPPRVAKTPQHGPSPLCTRRTKTNADNGLDAPPLSRLADLLAACSRSCFLPLYILESRAEVWHMAEPCQRLLVGDIPQTDKVACLAFVAKKELRQKHFQGCTRRRIRKCGQLA